MQASNYRRESLHSIMFSLEPCDWQMWFKNSYWWNLPLHCGIWTQRTKCSILSYTISWWTEVLFDHIPLLSNPLKHKINRICQNDYCITPLTHSNSRTEDNKIMDSSVLCAQSMGWFGFFFFVPVTEQRCSHIQRRFTPTVGCEWRCKETKKANSQQEKPRWKYSHPYGHSKEIIHWSMFSFSHFIFLIKKKKK